MVQLPEGSKPASRWLWRMLVVLILVIGVGGFVAMNKLRPQPVVRAPGKSVV